MNSTARWSAILMVCAMMVSPPISGGQTPADSERTAAGAVSDTWITAKTKIALFADDRVSGWDVKVDTKNGLVTLHGKVDSADAKTVAGQIARGIEGVKDVRNDLQVVAPSQRDRVDAKDEDIKDRVENQLDRDTQLKDADIDVEANKGVIRLTGEVETLGMSARASEQARQIPGVRAVKNELKLKQDDRLGRGGNGVHGGQERVRMAQEILKDKGHDPGPIDGMMGPQTRAAIQEFQKAEGLPQTGRLDGATIARLGLEMARGQ